MEKFEVFENLLIDELIVATGCTEPIALSYVASILKENIGAIPSKVEAYICGNILKNAKSVTVPNTHGLKGIKASLLAGLIVKRADSKLDLLNNLNEEDLIKVNSLMNEDILTILKADIKKSLYIKLIGYYEDKKVEVVLEDLHDNITFIKINDQIIFENKLKYIKKINDYSFLNINDIYEYSLNANLENLRFYLERQLKYNYEIALFGLNNDCGASIGKILSKNSTSLKDKIKAYTASASDARMAGIKLPVVILSGSGNQGITSSVGLKVLEDETKIDHQKILRALIFSDLITLECKKDIGRLSAFCGVVCASIGLVSGIAFANNKTLEEINHIIVNAFAISSGMICDGAKASCAAKISVALESAFIAYDMTLNSKEFKDGEGIIKKDADNTIKNIGRLARKGMEETDKEIIEMMIEKC